MKQRFYTAILLIATAYMGPAVMAEDASLAPKATPMKLRVSSPDITPGTFMKPIYAFCGPSASTHVTLGGDRSIGLSWSKGPKGTKSYAIIAVDTDVPTSFADADIEGKTLSKDMKRKDFYHWVLFDIPTTITKLEPGQDSAGFELAGKSETYTPYGTRGSNDYSIYFAAQPERAGVYAGYDGPCPPWNDELVHHYHFKVFALDIASLGLEGKDTDGRKALQAMAPHILAQGEVIAKYTLNPALNPKLLDGWHGIGR